ncbi:MAG: hypothetical protein O3A01_06065 [bacterium]|nr:hypothetical protein [bacterium]
MKNKGIIISVALVCTLLSWIAIRWAPLILSSAAEDNFSFSKITAEHAISDKAERVLKRILDSGTYEIVVNVRMQGSAKTIEEVTNKPRKVELRSTRENTTTRTGEEEQSVSGTQTGESGIAPGLRGQSLSDETGPGFYGIIPKDRFANLSAKMLQNQGGNNQENEQKQASAQEQQQVDRQEGMQEDLYFNIERKEQITPATQITMARVFVLVEEGQLVEKEITVKELQGMLYAGLDFDPSRGESISVTTRPLISKSLFDRLNRMYQKNQTLVTYAAIALIGVVVLFLFLVLILKYLEYKKGIKDAMNDTPKTAPTDGIEKAKTPEEVSAEVSKYAKQNPDEVLEILQAWLKNEGDEHNG